MLNYILLLTALLLSGVAAYYSIVGLTAIFAAAFWPIVIMGSTLELGKVVGTSWVYRNWHEAPALIKYYLASAIVILSIITSLGIFGFLSKAHLDQALPVGDIDDQVQLYDQQIQNERDNITQLKTLLQQMDDVVKSKLNQEGRTLKRKGLENEEGETEYYLEKEDVTERALRIRRSQAKDRANIIDEIKVSQNKIIELTKEKAPIEKEYRNLEAEVGPIKYVAELIYGDSDRELLEQAVRAVIILIVFVFDPLALMLIIAANFGIKYSKPVEEKRGRGRPKGSTNKLKWVEKVVVHKEKRDPNKVEIDKDSIVKM